MFVGKIARRDLFLLASLVIVQSSDVLAQITPIPEPVATQKPNCTISQSIVDFAEKGDLSILTRARDECVTALDALNALKENPDRKNQRTGDLRYQKGLKELTGIERPIANMTDYAEVTGKIIGQNKAILDKLISQPAQVTDDEVITLFKNLAAISLLNAALIHYPSPA